ncbi:hypothetical protein B0J14DRAFT_619190 [Halenospora varia]|nr:hypothetical protein B0J14DRAFT_619190 [Halenospora varia]
MSLVFLKLFWVLLMQFASVLANTEKTIFLGPPTLQVPVEHPTLEDLRLEALSPQHWSLRTHIRAEFPTNSSKYGQASWYLLHRLEEGQRYEQPTSFRLETYDLQTVFDTPELITSLAEFSELQQADPTQIEDQEHKIVRRNTKSKHTTDDLSSTLFLQVFAAADYYTTNKTLMQHVPPVYVDIILDPFLSNVFPRSLVPTAAYITLLAIGSWFVAKYISDWLQNLDSKDTNSDKKDR